jgi:putative membrane-bound dehydrogenase-like protein
MKMVTLMLGASLAGVLLASPAAQAAGRQLTGQHAPAKTPALPPAEAQKRFVLPPQFEARLFAAEPDIVNPVAMTWDERGRLWVIELYEYPMGAPAGTKPRDRIKILEDTDNDGRADKVKVFADGLNLATGLLLGNGGVYVGQAPEFLFLQDTNRDDVADTRTVLLSGFGLDDRHELLNGFTWGPDGGLYMTHGVFTHSKVKVPEASEPGVEVTAAVARYEPRSKAFEVFAEGTSNPWGVDFDRYGNAFVSACVIDHLFHMAPGGLYARQGGTPPNPYAYELLPSIVHHTHHMAAYAGVCVYQGDLFPEEFRGHVLMGNIHQNAINHDRLERNGSSFKAIAEKDFLTTPDGWFMPVSSQVGPDGALWIADWYDKYPCYQNAMADPEGVDREHGRIWRVVYATAEKPATGSRPKRELNLAVASNDELIQLLEHPNIWQRRVAQRLLRERSAPNANPADKPGSRERAALQAMLKKESRLVALWTLHGLGPDSRWGELLEQAMNNSEPAVRAWACRFEAEHIKNLLKQNNTDEIEQRLSLLQKLGSDPDPSVRLAVATTCRQLVSGSLTVNTKPAGAVATDRVLAALVETSKDAKDPLLPFMLWMAIEPMFAANPEPGLQWVADNGANMMPLSAILIRKAMRRLCDSQDSGRMDMALGFLSTVANRDQALALAVIDGLIEGQKAKPLVPRTDTQPLFNSLAKISNPQLQERARQLGTLWGDAPAVQATLKAIEDVTLPVESRIQAIAAAKQAKLVPGWDALMRVVQSTNPEPVLEAAVRALGELGGDSVPDAFLRAWSNFSPATRVVAAEAMVARRRWAMALLSAIEAKTLSAADISPAGLRALVDSKDSFVRQRAAQAIGRVRPTNVDKQKLIEQKRQMIVSGPAPDLEAGHELTRKTCLVCHKLYGEGAEVGPDLTGVGRSSLEALLANVIDPNQVVGKGYENVEIETKDGRTLSGRLVENTDTQVKLLASGPKEEIIAKSDMASMRVSELSVMPEGLEQMPEQDFRNMIAYILNPPQQKGAQK